MARNLDVPPFCIDGRPNLCTDGPFQVDDQSETRIRPNGAAAAAAVERRYRVVTEFFLLLFSSLLNVFLLETRGKLGKTR